MTIFGAFLRKYLNILSILLELINCNYHVKHYLQYNRCDEWTIYEDLISIHKYKDWEKVKWIPEKKLISVETTIWKGIEWGKGQSYYVDTFHQCRIKLFTALLAFLHIFIRVLIFYFTTYPLKLEKILESVKNRRALTLEVQSLY